MLYDSYKMIWFFKILYFKIWITHSTVNEYLITNAYDGTAMHKMFIFITITKYKMKPLSRN